MMHALLWFTVCATFMLASQQELAKKQHFLSTNSPVSNSEEETSSPLSNGSEEKAPNGSNSFSEEYLHDHHITDHFFSIALQYHKCENAGTYIAFHGELLVPPPDAA